ncbi:DUF2214 family protein [Brevundimonas sp. Root1279]|uniref:DUF2214 family protein n=1 Tax=Brevundimonas sp. Root1279 TaxID=1736443 RepID=UPI000A7C3A34|nr:DUF2214 family protein [Brevundimonas sp. Root1279]
MTDLLLAIAHHILVFGLVAMLAVERVLLRGSNIDFHRLARVDTGYGALAGLILVVGACRVLFGGKGWEFYDGNPYFWAKVATFILIGIVSIVPTVRYQAWARLQKRYPAFTPPDKEVARVRTATGVQALLLVPLLVFAAMMARWPG